MEGVGGALMVKVTSGRIQREFRRWNWDKYGLAFEVSFKIFTTVRKKSRVKEKCLKKFKVSRCHCTPLCKPHD